MKIPFNEILRPNFSRKPDIISWGQFKGEANGRTKVSLTYICSLEEADRLEQLYKKEVVKIRCPECNLQWDNYPYRSTRFINEHLSECRTWDLLGEQ